MSSLHHHINLRLSSQFPLMANVLAEREAWTFGLLKWRTLPSSFIMFTSSIPCMLFTPSFFKQFYKYKTNTCKMHLPRPQKDVSACTSHLNLLVIGGCLVNDLLFSSRSTLSTDTGTYEFLKLFLVDRHLQSDLYDTGNISEINGPLFGWY